MNASERLSQIDGKFQARTTGAAGAAREGRAPAVAVERAGEAAVRGLAWLGILVSSPLWAVTAVAVGVTLGRPILFRQARAGLDARPLVLTKFRTMTNERAPDGTLLPDDERVRPATRLIRRLRLDELPQLLAVARGDLALVGPRPLLETSIVSLGPLGQLRCSVRPGLTGWAQVSGNTRLSDEQKMALDIWYVDHRTFWLDCWIIFCTARTILLGEKIHHGRLSRAENHVARIRG